MDYVVISDLHLGFDVYVQDPETSIRQLEAFERNNAHETERAKRTGEEPNLFHPHDFGLSPKSSTVFMQELQVLPQWKPMNMSLAL